MFNLAQKSSTFNNNLNNHKNHTNNQHGTENNNKNTGGIESANSADLSGYEEVPYDKWMNIDTGTFIRYEKDNGDIPIGGYIAGKSFEKNSLILQSTMNGVQIAKWFVNTGKIKRVWKRMAEGQASSDNIIARSIKSLHERLSLLENSDALETRDYSDDIAKLNVENTDIKNDIRQLSQVVQQLVDGYNENNDK